MNRMYKGAGNSADYEQSLEFLNWVFFTDDPADKDVDFLAMIPKLYKKEYNHCENNLIVSENGKWQAAVGLYFDKFDVGGEQLVCAGIGNVAVGKNCRGKGYMKDCMALAEKEAFEKDADFMVLGGQRQRYGYFGFEPAGKSIEFIFNSINQRHVYGKDYISSFTAKKVMPEDKEEIKYIEKLYNKTFTQKIIRKSEKFYDILKTWYQVPYIFEKNGEFKGYALYNPEMTNIMEFAAETTDDFKEMLPEMLKITGKDKINICVSPAAEGYCSYLYSVCEWMKTEFCGLYNILNWKKTVYALLKEKSERVTLCDGEHSFLIHGYKKDELFTLKVENNNVSVADGGENSTELSHKKAANVFAGLYRETDISLPPNISQWLPLDFMIFSTDKV